MLILILGVAGPVIEKRLKKAGKVDQARKLRDVLDTVLSKDEAEKEEAPEAEPGPGKVLPTPPVTTEKYDPGMPYTTFSVSPELLEGGYRSVKEIADDLADRLPYTLPRVSERPRRTMMGTFY